VCDVLAQRIRAARAVITGAGHGVQKTGGPFNAALKRLWQRVGAQDA
jgi:citrate synthase